MSNDKWKISFFLAPQASSPLLLPASSPSLTGSGVCSCSWRASLRLHRYAFRALAVSLCRLFFPLCKHHCIGPYIGCPPESSKSGQQVFPDIKLMRNSIVGPWLSSETKLLRPQTLSSQCSFRVTVFARPLQCLLMFRCCRSGGVRQVSRRRQLLAYSRGTLS